jgi:hypothetical protein
MALVSCKECNAKISTKADACPQCGAKIKKGMGCGSALLLLSGFMFFIIKSMPSSGSKTSTVASTPSTPSVSPKHPAVVPQQLLPKKRIDYSIVKTWEITNGGYGKAIVIDPRHANESDMILLASTIKSDVSADRNAFVFVFTSREAALMRDRLNSLTERERGTYHKAYVGSYSKNGNNGLEEMEIHPEGLNGSSRTIKPK